jgi:ADP-heptose:LPS heptosyltransferase
VLDRTDCEFHVVQSEVREADKAVLLNELPHVIDHSALSHDFADTAALISMLDLVIAVDTSVAHLSGAIGWPSWLLVRANADWRWQPDRDDSPWYPTMFLFHQSEPGVWQPVLDQVIQHLDERLV